VKVIAALSLMDCWNAVRRRLTARKVSTCSGRQTLSHRTDQSLVRHGLFQDARDIQLKLFDIRDCGDDEHGNFSRAGLIGEFLQHRAAIRATSDRAR
jgi:hypothetical protein